MEATAFEDEVHRDGKEKDSTDRLIAKPVQVNLEDTKLRDLLIQEWTSKQNQNAFLFAKFIERYPVFATYTLQKGSKNTMNYVLKKSLFCRFVNKVMSRKGTNTGKKVKAYNLVFKSLNRLSAEKNLEPNHLLVLAMVKSVPNFIIRRLKFGSGFITRAVRMTLLKKVSWFLKNFADVLKARNTSFNQTFGNQLEQILKDSPKSKILSMKRESIAAAQKANFQ